MLEMTNRLGAIAAIAFYVLAILVFGARLLGAGGFERPLGWIEFLLAIPLVYLLLTARQLERPTLYYVQIGCMLAWLLTEALLDYILKVNFRDAR